MLRAALPLLCAAGGAAAAPRRVRWYAYAYAESDAADLAAWAASAGVVSGVYLCCNYAYIGADGAFTPGPSRPHGAAVVAALRGAGLPVWVVAGAKTAVIDDAAAGVAGAAAWAAKVGADGYVFDYEPDSNYTQAHVAAYASFLDALAGALHADGRTLAADIAGWGILDAYAAYGATAADLLTSMSPTYHRPDAAAVDAMLAAVPAERLAVGLSRDDWNETVMHGWVDTLLAKGVREIDVWPPTHVANTSAWMVAELARFLAAP